MAATYGYGGEFSSDEDIDRMEQQSERLTNSKFDSFAQIKPTKHQIEEAIEAIRRVPITEENVNVTDELLAGLLDYYKVQRGPIVDSTRTLYKKIVLRLVRNQIQQSSNGNEGPKDTNGNVNLINKNQEINVTPSSDEDEPMPPVSSQSSVEQNKRKFDSRVVYHDNLEPMEVDSETPARPSAAIRNNKPVDMSSSDSSETESSSDDTSDDSEVLDVTPIKPQAAISAKVTSTPLASVVKPAESVSKKVVTPIAADPKKKPYTRSQRVAANKATSSTAKKADVSSSKSETSLSSQATVKPLTKSAQSSKFKVRYLVSTFVVVLLALFLYYFRSDLTKTTDRILSKTIKF